MKLLRVCVFWFLVVCLTSCDLIPTTSTDTDNGVASPATSAPESSSPETPALIGNADIIFTNGTILTMDAAHPSAKALAIQGNKILSVGTNEEVLTHRGSNTIVIDIEGRIVTPGFIDSHAHRITSRAVDTAGYPSPEAAIPDILAQGWTTVNELVAEQDQLDYLTDLDSRGELRVRVNEYMPVNYNDPDGNPRDKWYEVYEPGQMLSPRVRIAGLKVFTDFDNATYLLWEQDELNAFLLEQHQNGWQLAIKTVSTYSLEMILIAIENIQKIDPGITSRHVRLEHAIFATPEQIARIKTLGMVPSIQTNNPGQLVGDPGVEALIAREPQGSAFPWRSYVEAGIPIANGAAWPSFYVVPPSGAPMGSPMRLIQQAITREGNSGQSPEPWMLAQSITAEQALRGLTIEAAMGTLQDDVLGSLTSGKLADMVILSANPLQTPVDQIKDIEVLMTMIDGKVEFCAAGHATLCPSASAGSSPTVSSSQPVTDSVDLTLSASLTASASIADQPASNAVDGNPDTVWNSGADPRQWIRFEFDPPRMISSVRLTISQYPEGYTVHRIWGGSTEENVQMLHEFTGNTTDGQILEFQSSAFFENIRILYIVTTESPSWVAWREIEIMGK